MYKIFIVEFFIVEPKRAQVFPCTRKDEKRGNLFVEDICFFTLYLKGRTRNCIKYRLSPEKFIIVLPVQNDY